MTEEQVGGEDLAPQATVNAALQLAGTYRVTAEKGISLRSGRFDKDAEVELSAEEARALLNDGSVEHV